VSAGREAVLALARLARPSAGLGNRRGSGVAWVGQPFNLRRDRCPWTLLLRRISRSIRHLRLKIAPE
jgi:hypothetical protein